MAIKGKRKISGLIKDKIVLWGPVTRLGRTESGEDYMEVSIPDTDQVGVIMKDEADAEIERKSLVPLLGHPVPFMIIEISEDGDIVCSRKQAQEQIREEMMQDLVDQKVLHGTIDNITPYGAYISFGGLSGLLKNEDYVNAATPLDTYLKVGQTLDVVCKNLSVNGKIQLKPAEPPKVKPIKYDVEENTCVMGEVINMRPFERGGVGVFVRIGTGLDALCMLPADMEVNTGNKVAVRIQSVSPSEDPLVPPHVRAKILRVM